MKVLVLHGTHGGSQENWFPWLKGELQRQGIECAVPDLPASDNPRLDWWMEEVEKRKFLDNGAVVVAHSLGCILALRLLEGSVGIKGAVLVAPFTGKLGTAVDEVNKDFLGEKFDWGRIRENCKRFVVFYSDNDPFVPVGKSLDVAGKLGAKPVMVKGAGHFNARAGYLKFPLLLQILKGF